MIIAQFVAVLIIGYLLGAIPFGVLIGRRFAKVDVRSHGSGKIGTTNVLRVAGKRAAALALGLDLLKGALAVVFAGLIVGRNYLIVGNLGLGLCPVVALFGGEVFILGAGLTRFASLGSIAGVVGTYTILVPLTILHGFPIEYLVYTLIGTITIIVMHRGNIARLIAGTERKLGEKAGKIDSPSSDKGMG